MRSIKAFAFIIYLCICLCYTILFTGCIKNPDDIPIQAPIADFTVSSPTPDIGRSVKFTDQSLNNPTSWLWTFGDGTKSTLQNPSTIFKEIGFYTVSLTVTNSAGSNTKVINKFITIGGQLDSVTDFEGNVYLTIKIGNQWWMTENLKSTKFNDGTPIPMVTDSLVWVALTTPGFCWYNNKSSNKDICGALYNWHAVNTGKLAPTGWHLPTDAEWKQLEVALGMTQLQADSSNFRGTDQGTQLKNRSGWPDKYENRNGTNTSGFSAIPGGYRFPKVTLNNGSYTGQSDEACWWSSTVDNIFSLPWCRAVFSNPGNIVARYIYPKTAGFSVRCVKD